MYHVLFAVDNDNTGSLPQLSTWRSCVTPAHQRNVQSNVRVKLFTTTTQFLLAAHQNINFASVSRETTNNEPSLLSLLSFWIPVIEALDKEAISLFCSDFLSSLCCQQTFFWLLYLKSSKFQEWILQCKQELANFELHINKRQIGFQYKYSIPRLITAEGTVQGVVQTILWINKQSEQNKMNTINISREINTFYVHVWCYF